MVRGRKKPGDLLARSDLCHLHPRTRGGRILRDRREAAVSRSGRRTRGDRIAVVDRAQGG